MVSVKGRYEICPSGAPSMPTSSKAHRFSRECPWWPLGLTPGWSEILPRAGGTVLLCSSSEASQLL